MSYERNPAVMPKVGEVWTWRPSQSMARSVVEVVEVKWNGEEWWVKSRTLEPAAPLNGYIRNAPWDDREGKECWNDLALFVSSSKRGRHGKRYEPWLPMTLSPEVI